jgi:hypothetical protein
MSPLELAEGRLDREGRLSRFLAITTWIPIPRVRVDITRFRGVWDICDRIFARQARIAGLKGRLDVDGHALGHSRSWPSFSGSWRRSPNYRPSTVPSPVPTGGAFLCPQAPARPRWFAPRRGESECSVKQQHSPAKKASGAPDALAVGHGGPANRPTRSQPPMTAIGDR